MKNLFLAIITFLGVETFLIAQPNLSIEQNQDSLLNLFTKLVAEKDDSTKLEINKQIIGRFEETLKNPESFSFSFDKLKNISRLKSQDGLVQIINWNIEFTNGEFLYFGFVQHLNNKKQVKLYTLTDQSQNISNPLTSVLSEKKWYGALYYKILTNSWKKNTYYTLLGWDGNTIFTNKKLIEIMSFEGEKLVFGPPIIKMENTVQNRLIFEYAEQAKMMVRYDEKLDLVVWDHLAPSQPNFKNQYMYYGPDLSQDGMKFKDGYWNFKANLDLRNMEKSTGKSIKKSF
ncbi:MAG: hypothetical protein U0W24_23725 [Bacteroidales bacterium]